MPDTHRLFSSILTPRLVGETILIQLFMCYIFVYACFMAGISFNFLLFPAALTAGCLLSARKSDYKEHNVWYSFLATFLLWAFAIFAGSLLMDYSYDGNGYHQEVVAALCDGWRAGETELSGIPMSIWSSHYAKGIEMMGAAVVAFTGNLESGKSVNFMMGFSAFFLMYSFVRKILPLLNRKKAFICAFVAICNPIYISQMGTFYIDFAKYLYTLISILFIFEIYTHPTTLRRYLMLGLVTCLAIATKFNAFFEEGVVIFAGMLWIWWRNHKPNLAFKIGLCGILSAITGVIVLGYHPYMTNYLSAGHPLYPLMGEGSIDIMTGNTPAQYLAHGRIHNFVHSLLTVNVPKADARQGGFGPLMVIMLIISFISIWRSRKVGNGVIIYISAWVIASCFFFEQSWWARYIPQLWLIVAAGTTMLLSSTNSSKLLLWVQLSCIGVTAAVSFASSTIRSVRAQLYRNVVISEFVGQEVQVTSLRESFRRQMREKGVTAIPASSSVDHKAMVPYYGMISNPDMFPMILTDSITRDRILMRIESLPFDYSKQFNPNPEKQW